MLWDWSRTPVLVTPDGGTISAGELLYADCVGVSSFVGSATPSVTFHCDAKDSQIDLAYVQQDGFNIRNCIGLSVNEGICDISNGLTVIKGGAVYRNTNVLEFQGNANLSGAFGKAILNILAGGDVATPYATRIDFISETVFYKGEAAVGSADSSGVWRISKTTMGVDGDVTSIWANGSDSFTNAWTDRLTLGYS